MHRVVAVGHPESVAGLIGELKQGKAPRAVGGGGLPDRRCGGVPGGLRCAGDRGIGETRRAVAELEADTVAVLACPELSGARLRELTWELESSETEVYVAPALLDIAEGRTTIRPVAGLPLLHVDHPRRVGEPDCV